MAEVDSSFLESPEAFPQVAWQVWFSTWQALSTHREDHRAICSLAYHAGSGLWVSVCFQPDLYLVLTWLAYIQCSFGTSLGNEGKPCGEISEFLFLIMWHFPSRRYLPASGGKNFLYLWQHSAVKDLTGPRRLRMGIMFHIRKSSVWTVKWNNSTNFKEMVFEEIGMCALIWILHII